MNKENELIRARKKKMQRAWKRTNRKLKFQEFMNTMYNIIGTFHMFEISVIIMWICIITLNLQKRRIDINNITTLDSVSIITGIVVLILSMIVSTFFVIVLLYRVIRRRRKKNTETILALDIGEATTDFIYTRPNVTPIEHTIISGSGSIKNEKKKEIEY